MATQLFANDFNFGAPTYSPSAGTSQSVLGGSALQNRAYSLGQPSKINMPGADNTGGMDLGFNMGTAQLALGGLQSLGSIFSAFNAQKLAKKQFEYQKSVSDTNLVNSIQSYNTNLADKARARGAMEGQSQAQVDGYVAQNSLRRQ